MGDECHTAALHVGNDVAMPKRCPSVLQHPESCFSVLGCTGAVLRSPLRRRHRDSQAAAQPDLCHVHQRQQSRQVPHPSLPELVSFLHEAGLPLAAFSPGALCCREVGCHGNPSWLLSLCPAPCSQFTPSHVSKME